MTATLVGGCAWHSSGETAQPVTNGDQALNSVSEQDRARFDEPFRIEAADISAGAGAPAWCADLLSVEIRSLPTAVMAVGEAPYQGEVTAVLAGAVATLRSDTIAMSPVAEPAENLAAALTSLDVVAQSNEGFDVVVDALDNFGKATTQCEFSERS